MNTSSLSLKLLTAAMTAGFIGTAANAAVVTWNGTGDPLNSANNDLGIITNSNGEADTIIMHDEFSVNSSSYNITGGDTVVLENGGVLRNVATSKNIKGNGGTATINVGTGGAAMANSFRDIIFNLSGDGSVVFFTISNPLNASIANITSDWTGSFFFGATDAAGVLAYLDAGGANRYLVDGVALTSADLGTKFVLTEVAANTGGAPDLFLPGGVDGSGVYLNLVVPEPSSLALVGLGGLCVLRRRRK